MDPANDEYITNYYSYYEHLIDLSLNYEFPFELFTSYKPIAILGFSYELIHYIDRPAKDITGKYLAVTQKDSNYTLSFNLRQNIAEFWNYYFGVTFTRYNSNMKWEAYGTYNYNYLTISLGTALSF